MRRFLFIPKLNNLVKIDVCSFSSGSYFSSLIDGSGRTWCWGMNNKGQLGNNSTDNKCTPYSIYGNRTFCKIAGTEYVMLAIDQNGKAWAWGENTHGNIGINSTGSASTPVAVCGAHTFCQIQGGQLNVALDNNGKAWAWGRNTIYGAVGDNTTSTCRMTPVAVCGGHTFVKIFVGSIHSFAVDNHNDTWGWGINQSGQIGINSVCNGVLTPKKVLGSHTFCEIGVGLNHTVGIDNHGQAWAWGLNNFGQLGRNNDIYYSTPVAVCGGRTFSHVQSGGYDFTIVLDNHGKAWSWGYNYYGQLGTNNTTDYSTPAAVCGTHTFCFISTKWNHVFAQEYSGELWGWGSNFSGELGIEITSACEKTPVLVYLPSI